MKMKSLYKNPKKNSINHAYVLAGIVVLFASVLYFNSCNTVDPHTKALDNMSGVYYMHGTKISTVYPCTFTCFDMEPYVDTTRVAFTMNMEPVDEKKDTLLFFGLLGADAGDSGPYQHTENLFPIELFYQEEYKIYANVAGNTFEIELWSAGPHYKATGIVEDGMIELEGYYRYRNRTFAYSIAGKKINF